MDAEKRHELKQNELAETLRGIADFSDKRTWAWLAAIIAVALIYAGFKYVRWQEKTQWAEVAQRLSAIDVRDETQGEKPLNDLRDLLAQAKTPGAQSLIRLKLAEGLELRSKEADGAAKLAEAESEYERILSLAGVEDSVKAPALYRLGLLNETKRDFAKARESFTKLSENPRYAGSPFVAMAKERLDKLDELAVPVVFTPGNKPLPVPASAPVVNESEMKSVLDTGTPAAPVAPVPVAPATQAAPAAEQPGGAASEPQETPAQEPTEEPVEPEQP